MQTPDAGDEIRLTFYCKTPDSTGADDCASFYRTNRGSWTVQGDRQDDSVADQLRGFKDHETFLEIPDNLADTFARLYVKERYGIDIGRAAEEADRRGSEHGQA